MSCQCEKIGNSRYSEHANTKRGSLGRIYVRRIEKRNQRLKFLKSSANTTSLQPISAQFMSPILSPNQSIVCMSGWEHASFTWRPSIDEIVSKTVDFEPRHSLGNVVLMCRHMWGKCSTESIEIFVRVKFFNRTIRVCKRFHPLVLEIPAYRATHYRCSAFFNRIIRL